MWSHVITCGYVNSMQKVKEIMAAVTIPVMAKCRIGHFAEAQILQSLGVDFLDESEGVCACVCICVSCVCACVCMCVCACVYMCVCMCVHVCVHVCCY